MCKLSYCLICENRENYIKFVSTGHDTFALYGMIYVETVKFGYYMAQLFYK